jgi:hypothetical protein
MIKVYTFAATTATKDLELALNKLGGEILAITWHDTWKIWYVFVRIEK